MFKNKFLIRRSDQLDPSPIRDRQSPPEPLLPRDSRLILLAEQDLKEQDLLTGFLEGQGFRLLRAHEGEAALEMARRHRPALVLCSVDLPTIDGYKICQKLRESETTDSIPVVLICPQGNIPDKLIKHETYASDYIQRPINLDALSARIAGILRRNADRVDSDRASEVSSSSAPTPGPEPGKSEISVGDIDAMLREFQQAGNPMRTTQKGQAPLDEMLRGFKENDLKGVAGRPLAEAEPVAVPEPVNRASKPEISGRTASKDLPGEVQVIEQNLKGGDALYQAALRFSLDAASAAEAGKLVDIERGEALSANIVTSLTAGIDLLLLATSRDAEYSWTLHSVNVAIISARIGLTLGYSPANLSRLALAGMWHDIGTVRLPKELLDKPGQFTRFEVEQVRKRPSHGAELLKGLGPVYVWLAEIVEQVSEREQGQGFPRGLNGKEIREEAKILGIADVFEACIHDRPYRLAITGYRALEELTTESGTAFSARIFKALIRSFSVYPFNEYVILNTGEVGKVVDINRDNALRPTVEIMFDSRGEKLLEPKTTNLSRNPSLFVTKAITRGALPQSA
ncbi:MAG: HD domain-containing phosphohydrolase [Acidobacteriota bacterium]